MNFWESNKKYIVTSVAIMLLVGGFLGGYFFSNAGFAIDFKGFKFVDLNRANAPKDVNWQILWDAYQAVNSKYVDRPIDQQKMLYGAVSGMVASLGDPYTTFFTPTQSQDFKSSLSGEFSGIGAEIGQRNGVLVVISPLEGSPAERAGIKPMDKILKINNESTEKLSVDEAVGKIRGPKGTQVSLNLMSDGAKTAHDVTITRDTIVVKSITTEVKGEGSNKVGIIHITRYGDDTKGDMDAAITKLLNENVKGIVLDERNNPGGYITTAVDIASNWVDEGKLIVSEQFGDGRKNPYNANGVPRLKGIPTVVLVNEGSASASEIVAGALKDYSLATLVGKKTFGKGSVQELVDLPEGTNVKITIAKWLTPSGANINHDGIKPDIEVEITADDVNAGRDPQMDRAVATVQEKIK